MLHGGVLSGFVYIDADGDGTRDDGEAGVPGVLMSLSGTDNGGAAVDLTTLSQSDGSYSFDDLNPGTYAISENQPQPLFDGQESTSATGATMGNDQIATIALGDEQTIAGNDFGEGGLRPEYVSLRMFLASTPAAATMLRATIADSEEAAGNTELAASIRAGATDPPAEEEPADPNDAPVGMADTYAGGAGGTLTVPAASGVLSNDTDADGDTLTAQVVATATNGTLTLNADGGFTYTPMVGFDGTDTFTYRASDGQLTSNTATVTITVTDLPANTLFGAVTPGSFQQSGLLGTRTDLVSGAPAITATHIDGDIDYTGYSNPPTYGPHHGFDANGTDANPGITPRPTGVHTTEQPDEDLVHNLEHGHVWISYNPSLIGSGDLAALEQFVRDGSPDENGGGVGVILTPRAANDAMIAVASWAHLLKLSMYDPATIRDFVETNRGKAPEGFITP
jgi:VCBS repeat-containing protein